MYLSAAALASTLGIRLIPSREIKPQPGSTHHHVWERGRRLEGAFTTGLPFSVVCAISGEVPVGQGMFHKPIMGDVRTEGLIAPKFGSVVIIGVILHGLWSARRLCRSDAPNSTGSCIKRVYYRHYHPQHCEASKDCESALDKWLRPNTS